MLGPSLSAGRENTTCAGDVEGSAFPPRALEGCQAPASWFCVHNQLQCLGYFHRQQIDVLSTKFMATTTTQVAQWATFASGLCTLMRRRTLFASTNHRCAATSPLFATGM